MLGQTSTGEWSDCDYSSRLIPGSGCGSPLDDVLLSCENLSPASFSGSSGGLSSLPLETLFTSWSNASCAEWGPGAFASVALPTTSA